MVQCGPGLPQKRSPLPILQWELWRRGERAQRTGSLGNKCTSMPREAQVGMGAQVLRLVLVNTPTSYTRTLSDTQPCCIPQGKPTTEKRLEARGCESCWHSAGLVCLRDGGGCGRERAVGKQEGGILCQLRSALLALRVLPIGKVDSKNPGEALECPVKGLIHTLSCPEPSSFCSEHSR